LITHLKGFVGIQPDTVQNSITVAGGTFWEALELKSKRQRFMMQQCGLCSENGAAAIVTTRAHINLR
jgi:hypothetical protein